MDRKNHSRLIPILVLISGVLLSSLSGWFLYKIEEKAIISEFQKDVDERAASLNREVIINFETLRSLAILFAQGTVPEWKQFSLEAQKILARHNDIQALEWVPRVVHSERATYESILLQDFPEFQFTERLEQGRMVTAEERQEYYPVYYVEPVIGNEEAIGFDLASNLARLETLEKSRDIAIPQATASITLVQERQNQKGFLAFLPIYKGSPATVAKRRDNLMGFVLGVYRIGDIFASSDPRHGAPGMEMKLVDETLKSSHDILHIHKPGTEFKVYESITYRKELPEVWGRKWSLIASPTLSYIAVRRNFLPIAILVSGTIITVLMSLYIYIISRGAATIQRIVIKKTKELNEANETLKENEAMLTQSAEIAHLGYAVWDEILNRDVTITEELARIHGFTGNEYRETVSSLEKYLELVVPEDREKYLNYENQFAADNSGKASGVEYRIMRPDGEIRYLNQRAQYLFVSSGQSTQSIVVIQDVTEQKQVELRLNESRKELEFLSRTDSLTGVANRRFMDEFIDKEWLRAIRNKSSISFILIDIDFFKLYNDNYGHPEGDECLKKVATKLKNLVRRPGDLIARYGGEEFALVLPDTKEAEFVANNCRQSIEELQIPHKFSEAANVVTISVGLCTVSPYKGIDPKSVIATADKALYKAKNGGRNRVEQMVFHP